MCMKAYSRETRLKLTKMLENHVKEMRKNIPWSGENDVIVKKIVKAIIVCKIFFLTRGVRKFINSIVLFRNFLGSLEQSSLVTKIQIIL